MTNRFRFRLLSEEEVGTIYDKCLDFLASRGLRVEHSEGLKMLSKAGAEVDFDSQQVRFPKHITEMALHSAPRNMTLAASDRSHDVILPHPDGRLYTRNSFGARSYVDPDTQTYRDTTLADVAEVGQLVEVLDEISFCAPCFPRDVPEETASIYATKTLFENTSKHLMVPSNNAESVEYLIQLALVVAGSTEALKKRPPMHLVGGGGFRTPFIKTAAGMEVLLQSCRYGMPLTASCLPNTGASSPITIAGTVLLSAIEILGAVVIQQLINPGNPVYAMPLPFALDMVTGRVLQGSVESILASVALVQFIKDTCQIPTHPYAFGTDSYIPDGQAMIETTLRGLLVSLAGCDILGGAGQLDTAAAFSPIQLIIDSTQINILNRVISGVKVDDDTLALKELWDIAPGGQFLECAHTLKHCREALRTDIFVNRSREVWVSEGGKDLYARALEKYKELKKKPKPRPLADDMKKEMERIVKAADKHLVRQPRTPLKTFQSKRRY